MDKLTNKQIGNAKVNPVFKGLSDDLKDPKNFKKIENKLARVMLSDHKHRTIGGFHLCKRCQKRFEKKREMLKELGFESINQYQNWKKIMMILLKKERLVLYPRK